MPLQPTESIQAHSAALKKELGLGDLVLTQILYVVGSAWVGTAAKLGSAHTTFWLLAILLFYVPLGLVVIYVNRLMPVEGGLYQWAKLGFNPFAGFLVGWNLWLYTIFLVSQLGVIFATNLSYALGPTAAWMSSSKSFITLITVLVTALLVTVTTLGLAVGKWVQNIGAIAQILTYSALLLIPFLTYRTGALERYHPLAIAAPTLSLFSLNVFGKMSMGAFSGFEYVAILAGECKSPARSIARSIIIATPIIALMFVLGTDSVLAIVPREEVDLVGPVPQVLSIGFRQIGFVGPIAAVFILLLAARQIGNCTLAMAGCSRLPMVAGWDHLLPRWFSVLHPRYRTPMNSTLFVGAMVLVMGLAGIAGVGHQEAYQLLENASGIFYGLAYVALFALPVFGLRSFGRPPLWLRVASASGLGVTVLYCVLSIFPIVTVSSWFSFAAKISGVVLGANAVGVLLYLAASRARKLASGLALVLLAAGLVVAQSSPAQSLDGAIDIHVHSDPDSLPRSLDAVEAARLAKARGMRAIVLKNHYEPTASLAYVVRKVVPGIEVFGGIDLNRTIGGINPAAVEHMTRVKGGWGRVVWMPTFDAENQVRYSKESLPFVRISRNGELLPEVKEVIGLIAKHGLVLATGHSSSDEALLLLREGSAQGVPHMVVTHAMLAPVRMTVTQMREAAKLGSFIEFVYNALIGPNKMFDIQEYAEAIRQVGPEWCILSSDLGQAGNPLPPDGLDQFFRDLRAQGFSAEQIDRMSKVNPAKLLGLPVNAPVASSSYSESNFPLTADPGSPQWKPAPSVFAETDSHGKPVPGHRTEIRSRWTNENLYVLFVCPYQDLYLKPDPTAASETNKLWNWDVAEAFIGDDLQNIQRYKEFEISPQGEWVDLDIDRKHPLPEGGWLWNSGFQSKSRIDPSARIWYGEMQIPWNSISAKAPQAGQEFRVNFYRMQGPPPDRKKITWQPTNSDSFHVPEAFGVLKLVAPGKR